MPVHKKKRQFESGRTPANTKLGLKRVHSVRCRGGNMKFRAIKLDHGNFSWASEGIARPTRIVDVVYNATNNELVRTKTLVKNCIVQIDGTPFKAWYAKHYGVELGKKKKGEEGVEVKQSGHVKATHRLRQKDRVIDSHVADEFGSAKLYAAISSRPGQSGRADGYILEGKELEFYVKKMEKKKK